MYYLMEHRKRRGLSQAQLARLAGVSTTPISRCERGGTIKPEYEAALAQALGVDITAPPPGPPPVALACEASGHCGHCGALVVFGVPGMSAVRASTRNPTTGQVVSTFWCRSRCFKLAHDKPATRATRGKPTKDQQLHISSAA